MRSSFLVTIATTFITLASGAQAQFLNPSQYDNGTNLYNFVQADINHDEKMDIVGFVTTGSAPSNQVAVLLANGKGGFDTPIKTTVSDVDNPSPQLVVGDFNGDGHVDVAVFGKDHVTGQSVVVVMLGNGNGTFQAGLETVLSGVSAPNSLPCTANAADYNGDGKLDIVYTSLTTVVFLPGNGNGTFSSPVSSKDNQAQCVTTGDFNNDKKLDLAGAGAGAIYLMLGNGDGTFKAPVVVGQGGNYLTAEDLNGDGNLDLVALQLQYKNSEGVIVFLGDGTGHFPKKSIYGMPAARVTLNTPIVQDLNGDGHPDIAVLGTPDLGNPGSTEVLGILLNNGDGTFTAGLQYVADAVGNDGFLAGDLNGDGKVDFAFSNREGGVSVLLGNGNGTFKGNLATPGLGGSDPKVGEFDGNATPDLLFAIPSASQILLGNGDGSFIVRSTGCGLGAVAVGDFNRDGKLDLAGNTSLSGVPVIGVCLGHGDGTFTQTSGAFDQGVQHRYQRYF